MYKATHKYQRKVKAQMGTAKTKWPASPTRPDPKLTKQQAAHLTAMKRQARQVVAAKKRNSSIAVINSVSCPACKAPVGRPCPGATAHPTRVTRFRSGARG